MPLVPPIKSQGIKTKLVDWIAANVEEIKYDRWVEPFMGTGVVGFNIRPKKALMCDSNPHLIKFYNGIKSKEITSAKVKKFLTDEGVKLLKSDGAYYYDVRSRFNETGRFAQALVTKISNQVKNISQVIELGEFTFKHQDFKTTLNEVKDSDLVYSDPPYIGRHVDYFDSWSEEEEIMLNKRLISSKAEYILSTWLSNKYRTNDYIFSIWKDSFIATKEHFYHVGGKESNRNAVYEALVSNVHLKNSIPTKDMKIKIADGTSQLTTSKSKYQPATQLLLKLEEEKEAIIKR